MGYVEIVDVRWNVKYRMFRLKICAGGSPKFVHLVESQHNSGRTNTIYHLYCLPNLARSAHLLLICLSLQPCLLGQSTFGVSFVDR